MVAGDQGIHIPVKTQYFSEDQNQDHSDKDSALVHERPDTLVPHNTDAVPSSEAGHADRDTTGEVHEAAEQAVVGLGVEVLGDEYGYDEGVDGDDTGHDDRDETLVTRRRSCQLRDVRLLFRV